MSGSEEGKSHELVIIRRRPNEEEGGHHGGVWKIAYADFMTAMMAFFLVMWLINSTDKKTLTQVATYFNPMRLTDKKPTPKGLEEPSGSEDKGTAGQKGSKKKDGDAEGKTKSENTHAGEAGSRGHQRELEEQGPKNPKKSGAASSDGMSPTGGRAFRDPFDPVHRTEITPGDPSAGRIVRATPPVTVPSSAEAGRLAQSVAEPAVEEAGRITPPVTAAPAVELGRTTPPVTATPVAEADRIASPVAPPSTAELRRDTPVEAKPTPVPQQPSKESSDRADAAQLETAIKKAVAESLPGILPNIDVVVTTDGVLISLTDDYEFGMFAIASAEPRPATIVVMDKIAKILQMRTEPLVIRGHTDRRPYRTAAYDNWRLSAARAHMAYVMLARSGLDEKRFERIEGYADRNLRVAYDPEAAQNRRIEILLRKQTP